MFDKLLNEFPGKSGEQEDSGNSLADLEVHLRNLVPSKLYAEVWVNPSAANLTQVFDHLRTLHRILYGYLPRQVITSLPNPGVARFRWVHGTLMFTDLAGFTTLMERISKYKKKGAQALLDVLNDYFSIMIQVITKAGGNLLEFTGDAMLVEFPFDQRKNDSWRAVRAGLRMQRAMKNFSKLEIMGVDFSIGMRIGLHVGRFMTADIGTPLRMEHVLLGSAVLRTKQAEGAGKVGQVSITGEVRERVKNDFRFVEVDDQHSLVIDDFTDEQLGDYDILPPLHRLPKMVLLDTSEDGLLAAIADAVSKVEPLASYIPQNVLKLLVENAASRGLPPDFSIANLLFVNLLGFPDSFENITAEEEDEIITRFSSAVSLINAEIESHGGVLKKVTYHHAGPDIMAFFGIPAAHTNDSMRAALAARSILEIVKSLEPVEINGEMIKFSCHIGITRGQVFAAEIGNLQGRREFNVQGNTVNTAARLMDHAENNQILITEEVYEDITSDFEFVCFENVQLKGRASTITLFELGRLKN